MKLDLNKFFLEKFRISRSGFYQSTHFVSDESLDTKVTCVSRGKTIDFLVHDQELSREIGALARKMSVPDLLHMAIEIRR